jgi:hypothetical protein
MQNDFAVCPSLKSSVTTIFFRDEIYFSFNKKLLNFKSLTRNNSVESNIVVTDKLWEIFTQSFFKVTIGRGGVSSDQDGITVQFVEIMVILVSSALNKT